jgi:Mce-associated membrane protein
MSTPDADLRATRRAQRQAERAARAQRKADAARQKALEAARAGGLFEGMEPGPRPGDDRPGAEQTGPAGDATAPAAATHTSDPAPARTPIDPARRRTLITVLAVASVLLVVVTGLATWQYVEAREATAVEEQIADAPRAATDAAREVATQMFTYDHRTVDADLGAVRDRLTDPALSEFVEQSMPTVASAAKQQEATVYATVAAAAPQEVVDGDNVTVLVMLNRMVSTKDNPEAASSASRLSMQMVRQDGQWKLAELNAL